MASQAASLVEHQCGRYESRLVVRVTVGAVQLQTEKQPVLGKGAQLLPHESRQRKTEMPGLVSLHGVSHCKLSFSPCALPAACTGHRMLASTLSCLQADRKSVV